MEIIGEDGSKITLRPNFKTVFGRGLGFSTSDRTVSRRHVVFSLEDSDGTPEEPRACFEVIGRNPIWVRTGMSGKVKIFRRSEKGEVGVGDWVCIGSQRPVWFAVKRNELEVEEMEEEEKEMMMEDVESSELDLESVDVANIDPVKEFGFLVTGHEFDQYPKQRIRDINDWDWFLEEPRQDSDDDEDVSDKRKKRGVRRKRGKAKGKDEDEDDWTGESEEDKEVITQVKKVQRPAYSTRSKDRNKTQKGNQNSRSLVQKKAPPAKQDESEDDPTLGGFIVDDDNEEAEQESDVDEDEEEEFADDDLDDE